MRILASMTLLAVLAGCSTTTPRAQCERDAVAELQVVERMVAEAETNLRRGYGTEEVVVGTRTTEHCETDQNGDRRCRERVRPITEMRATRIDLEDEVRALNQLRERAAAQRQAARSALASCANLPAR